MAAVPLVKFCEATLLTTEDAEVHGGVLKLFASVSSVVQTRFPGMQADGEGLCSSELPRSDS